MVRMSIHLAKKMMPLEIGLGCEGDELLIEQLVGQIKRAGVQP